MLCPSPSQNGTHGFLGVQHFLIHSVSGLNRCNNLESGAKVFITFRLFSVTSSSRCD